MLHSTITTMCYIRDHTVDAGECFLSRCVLLEFGDSCFQRCDLRFGVREFLVSELLSGWCFDWSGCGAVEALGIVFVRVPDDVFDGWW